MKSNTPQRGFTLIELVVVIVILGILAATALPKFINLNEDAGKAAAEGVAGSLGSATAINFSAKLVNNANATTVGAGICTNTAKLTALVSGIDFTTGAPTGNNQYKSASAVDCAGSGTLAQCTISSANYTTGVTARLTCTN